MRSLDVAVAVAVPLGSCGAVQAGRAGCSGLVTAMSMYACSINMATARMRNAATAQASGALPLPL